MVAMIIPKWANWLARDKNGELKAFVKKPERHFHGFWYSQDESMTDNGTKLQETNEVFSHVRWISEPIPLLKYFNGKTDKVNRHKELTTLLSDTYKDKNKDYGDSFGKSHAKYGAIAGLVRLSDKFNRLDKIIVSEEREVEDETVLDTLLDLSNYALMLYMELEGEK